MSSRRSPARPAAADHRTRVGRERRARTRARICTAALRVFADEGPDAPVINDFIGPAGIARGTFYNHFRTTDELLVATSRRLEDELIRSIETQIGDLGSPVERLATGVRLWLQRARGDPVFCAFIVRNSYRGKLVERQLTGDIRAGRRLGLFLVSNADVARDMVVGTIREAMGRMLRGRVPRTYCDDVARVILRGLGLGERVIGRLLAAPLPALPKPRPPAS